MPHIVGNLHHLEGRPGLMPCYSPGVGLEGFLLDSALWKNVGVTESVTPKSYERVNLTINCLYHHNTFENQ